MRNKRKDDAERASAVMDHVYNVLWLHGMANKVESRDVLRTLEPWLAEVFEAARDNT